jgi:Mn-dependent DtxR family transcriptional regulator
VGEKVNNEDFYTFNGYIKKDENILTASMEDYVEMIHRLSIDKGFTRINDLANALNVQPPSATKMVKKLSELKLADYERYGVVVLTESGKNIGKTLLARHNTVERLLKLLGVSNSILEETERIEHSINEETLKCIHDFLNFVEGDEVMKKKLEIYKNLK